MIDKSNVDADGGERVLTALSDPTCRTLLRRLAEPKTVEELSEECDVPISTLYRKVDELTEADLVEQQIVIRQGWQQTTQYEATFEELTVSIDDREVLGFRVGD